MKKPASLTIVEPANGSTRLKRKFAWLPTYVNGYMVWLEYYEILQAYIIEDLKVIDAGEDKFFRVGEWKDISKRTLD